MCFINSWQPSDTHRDLVIALAIIEGTSSISLSLSNNTCEPVPVFETHSMRYAPIVPHLYTGAMIASQSTQISGVWVNRIYSPETPNRRKRRKLKHSPHLLARLHTVPGLTRSRKNKGTKNRFSSTLHCLFDIGLFIYFVLVLCSWYPGHPHASPSLRSAPPNSALFLTGGGGTLVGQPLREATNGEAAIRAGVRPLSSRTDVSVWEEEEDPVVATFVQGRPKH